MAEELARNIVKAAKMLDGDDISATRRYVRIAGYFW